jgi:hypothetical protein
MKNGPTHMPQKAACVRKEIDIQPPPFVTISALRMLGVRAQGAG